MPDRWMTLSDVPSGPRKVRLQNPELDAVHEEIVEVKPGQTHVVRWRIRVGWLRFKSPDELKISTTSGRDLGSTDDPEKESTWKYEDCHAGTCDCRPVMKLTYMAQKEGRWRRTDRGSC